MLAACMLAAAVSCDDMNSVNSKWYEMGEHIYTGIVDSVKLSPGYERVKLDWQIGADPRITDEVICWNDAADSLVIEVPSGHEIPLRMSQIIPDLPEDTYVFVFRTKDRDGHRSGPVEEAVSIFGDKYISSLRPRSAVSVIRLANGTARIYWTTVASTAMVRSIVSWTDGTGQSRTAEVANSAMQTDIEDLPSGASIGISSVYLPEGSIDELRTSENKIKITGE